MQLGLFVALFGSHSIDEALAAASELGLDAVEIGAGAYPGSPHLDVPALLRDQTAREALLANLASHKLTLSALSVHGNPIHPDQAVAQDHHSVFRNAVELAAQLGVGVVNGFSGCPGDGPGAKNPNWVTCAWPDEFRDILDWQWREAVVPYWKEQAAFLKAHNVKFAIEMHPGFVVYSNETLLRLRDAVGADGDWIGANFDPSHLWWQGVNPIEAARQLGEEGALFHVHAKDTRVDPRNSGLNGNLDTKSYGDIAGRSWVFRSVGYGHGVDWWRDFVSVLRMVGYDFVLSIEHEDGLMSTGEGLRKAVETLRSAIVAEPAGPMFWARE